MYLSQPKKSLVKALLWIMVLSLVWAGIATKGTFNDEQDNWVAGQTIIQGKIPYRDFFSHHAPLTYYASAILQTVGSPSPGWIRFGVMSFWLLNFIITYSYVKSSMKNLVGLSFFSSALIAPLVSAHMLLAESLAAPVFMTLFWLMYDSNCRRAPAPKRFLLTLAAAGFVVLFAAPVYLGSFGLLLVFFYSTQKIDRIFARAHLIVLPLVLIVYGALPIQLLAHGAFGNFVTQYFVFNATVYHPYRLAHNDQTALESLVLGPWDSMWSRVRLASTATSTLVQTMLTTTSQLAQGLPLSQARLWFDVAIKSFLDTLDGFELLLWMGLFSCVTVLAYSKKRAFAIVCSLALLYLNVRNEELFHNAPLYFSAISIALIVLHAVKASKKNTWLTLAPLALLVVMGSFALPRYRQAMYQSTSYYYPITYAAAAYIQQQSLEQATIQNLSGDVGIFHALPRLASITKMYYYYPWIDASPSLRFEVLSALEAAKPTLVYAPYPLDYSPEIQFALERNYLLLMHGVYIAR